MSSTSHNISQLNATMNPAETVIVESWWSASTPHTFPCTAGVLIPWPLQHTLIWSHIVSSPYSAANCRLLTIYFMRTMNSYLWIAWNERNSSSGFIQLFSLFSYLERSLAPIYIFRFFSALAEFVPPALKMSAVLFISSWTTSAFNSFLEQSFLMKELSPFKHVYYVCIAG